MNVQIVEGYAEGGAKNRRGQICARGPAGVAV